MLLSIAGVQDFGTLYLPDNRFCCINKVYAAAVLAGLDKLAGMLAGYHVYIRCLVPNVIMYTVD